MIQKTYAEIQAETTDLRLRDLAPLEIAVLRNVMVESAEPYLRYYGAQAGFRTVIRYGGYNTAFEEAVGGSPDLLNTQTRYVLVCLKLENLSWSLARNFAGLSPEARRTELDRVCSFVAQMAAGIRRQTAATILWFACETPPTLPLALADAERSTISELNRFVRETLTEQANAYLVDTDQILARIGANSFYDARYWHIGRAPYGREALREMAFEAFKYIRALQGKAKKCLVLDCDNVLWGGVVGEDGLSGIQLGRTHPGSAYWEFQQEAADLAQRGVLLALCSKNNEQDVWDVFERHPDMLLRREQIAAARINWSDKATSLREIAAELNIGLDSLVYVDDSDFEVSLIRKLLPEVEVIHLPKNKAVENRDRLAACGWFDTPALSFEDARRGSLYAAEVKRQELKTSAADLEGYYESLEMTLEIKFADEFSTGRIAQLTQKTNQFNLTTRRYTDLDIRGFSAGGHADVVSARLVDRFGDAGIIGVAILTYDGTVATIDTLLLSCRVLGRRVEEALLAECVRLAASRNCRAVIGVYRPTAKNAQVNEFYRRSGFRAGQREGEFLLDIAMWKPPELLPFRRINSEITSVEAG